jgi:hypothetical protein
LSCHAEEETEVVYDQNEIIQRELDSYYTLKHTCDVCTDSDGPLIFVIPGHQVTKGPKIAYKNIYI